MRYFLAAIMVVLVVAGAWYYLKAHPAPITLPGTPSEGTTTPPIVAPKATYTNATADDIAITLPKPGDTAGSVVSASGEARGRWYFEGTFPVVVEDMKGNVSGQGVGSAEGEWTTNDFVAFTALVSLTKPYEGAASMVFKKDNPSGDPAHDASVSVPIVIQE